MRSLVISALIFVSCGAPDGPCHACRTLPGTTWVGDEAKPCFGDGTCHDLLTFTADGRSEYTESDQTVVTRFDCTDERVLVLTPRTTAPIEFSSDCGTFQLEGQTFRRK